jgi:hypothetical protein
MKITININQKTAKHISSPHTFYDCCFEIEQVMLKIQHKVDSILKIKKGD